MKTFAKLLFEIEQTTSTNEKVDRMIHFFRSTDLETAAWTLYFLSGQRPKKFISSKKLRIWAEELALLPAWLGEECYSAVGDTAEMIALVVASKKISHSDPSFIHDAHHISLATWMHERIGPLQLLEEEDQKKIIQTWWQELSTREVFVLNKLMTGGLRIGVSETLVYRAISHAFNLPQPTITSRLLGRWNPSIEFFEKVIKPLDESEENNDSNNNINELQALPLPFCLAAPLENTVQSLGNPLDWLVEWK